MKVKDLVTRLQEIENQELEVFVNSFADIGSGWSEKIADFEVIICMDGVLLEESQ